jgi:hypothetical protein
VINTGGFFSVLRFDNILSDIYESYDIISNRNDVTSKIYIKFWNREIINNIIIFFKKKASVHFMDELPLSLFSGEIKKQLLDGMTKRGITYEPPTEFFDKYPQHTELVAVEEKEEVSNTHRVISSHLILLHHTDETRLECLKRHIFLLADNDETNIIITQFEDNTYKQLASELMLNQLCMKFFMKKSEPNKDTLVMNYKNTEKRHTDYVSLRGITPISSTTATDYSNEENISFESTVNSCKDKTYPSMQDVD